MNAANCDEKFYNLLQGYILTRERSYLAQAGDLGRQLLKKALPLEEVMKLKEKSLKRLLLNNPDLDLADFAQASLSFLTELLLAYSQSYRASLDALEQAVKQVKESEGRFQALFESSPAGIWEEDFSEVKHYIDSLWKKGIRDFRTYFDEYPDAVMECVRKVRVIDVNNATLELYKAKSKQDLLESLAKVFNEESLRFFKEELLAFIAGQTRYTSEMAGVALDGEKVYHLFSICIAPGYEETWEKIILSDIDITKQKLSEEKEERLLAHLRQAQRMETIDKLTSGIAHDFNNIIAAILGNTEQAQRSLHPHSPVDAYLKQIIKASHRARDLVHHLSSFSRSEDLDRQKAIDVKSVVGDALKLIRAALPSTMELRVDLKPDCGSVMADETQIHRVIMNLCVNACHALDSRKGVIEVKLETVQVDRSLARQHPELETGPYVCLIVKDNGHGMAPEIQERIFDPFFTTKEKGKGTGLGLSVVHGIVKRNGGAIMVESKIGEGAVFRIYLPQITAVEKDGKPVKAPFPGGNERIMFVDDEEVLTYLTKLSLEQAGYRVTAFTDSATALESFKNGFGQYDLVITDQAMQGLSGMELAGEIHGLHPNLPIFLSTGLRDKIDARQAERIGVSKLLIKPVATDKLLLAIRETLDERPGTRLSRGKPEANGK